MNWIETTSGIPATARYHRQAIDDIIACVRDGVYCAVLGPRLCGKTVMLRFVEQVLAGSLGWLCIYIDLSEMRAATVHKFFSDLISLTGSKLNHLTGQALLLPEDELASSAVFRGFLEDYVAQLGQDVVLIIEHLEDVPTDLAQALLTSLRAAYMDQQTRDYRVTVVVSGALSLATLTVGESSPFRGIARRVFIGDLSEYQSEALIDEYLAAAEIGMTREAKRRLVASTTGDHYLIRKITENCVELARQASISRLKARNVDLVLRRFLREDVFGYAPLLDAVRLIEGDPDLLYCVLMLLEREEVPKGELPLPLSPDLDPLYLTGIVERVGGDHYRVQNKIYRQFLAEYFYPGRVGRTLAMAGRWDSALDFLEAGVIGGDEGSRVDLLPATINSMHASQDLPQAAHFLARGLSAAFGVAEAQVWYAPPQEACLRLIGGQGNTGRGASWAQHEISIGADCLEARAFRQKIPLRGQESGERILQAIPLLIPGNEPLGVVTILEELLPERIREQRERELHIQGYLTQAARALLAVSEGRRELALAGRLQASLLPQSTPECVGYQLAATWRPARETSGDFYDFIPLSEGRLGILIADVVDKGVGAALYMALSNTLIRTYAREYPLAPEYVLHTTNKRLLAEAEVGQFVTAFYAVLDPSTGTLAYCNAGHNPPCLMNGTGWEHLHRTGMVLGVSEEANWNSRQVNISPGGILVHYTDGVVDAENYQGENFGLERVLAVVERNLTRPADEIQNAIISAVYEFAGDEPQVDDITLVIVRRD